ncbi:hypothetical protein SCORR_v1c02220 [Spiroplasma corruscae]|uniref:ABC3 transporter permease C-terminal domain-containing protein n=1 Tax=Spiroplasma corruscae TaxID=216934 RepID=A0A222ENC3_9MOLU|nr:FtsX-like permease family protein [Spiroplasma corruscae]ASP27997.1 hypothetical protein SCORR_v1c02220 [Spiroplasma corruscae]
MIKIFFKQFLNNIKIYTGLFLILLITSIFLSTSSLLLTNCIYAIINKESLNILNPILILNLFSGLAGIIIFLGLFSIFSCINLTISLKRKHYNLLRVLGLSFKRIKITIFYEIMILVAITISLSLPISVPLSKLLLNYLKENNAIEHNFYIFKEYEYQYIYVIATFLFIILVTLLATISIKNLNYRSLLKKTSNKTKHIFKIIFGAIFLLIPLALVFNKYTMEGELGQGLIINFIISFIIGFSIIGKGLIGWVLFKIYKKTNTYFIKIMFGSILKNLDQIFYALVLLICTIMFSSYAVTLTNLTQYNNNINNFIPVTNVFLLIIFCYSFIIFSNSLVIYLIEQRSDYKLLRVIGLRRQTSNLLLIFSTMIISFITVFIWSITYIIFIGMYYYWNSNISYLLINIKKVFIINIIIILLNLLVSIGPIVYISWKY